MVLVLSSYAEKPWRCRGCRRKNTAERQENNLVPIRHPTRGHSSSSVTSYIRLSLPSTATTLVWVPSLANTRNTLTLAWQSVILNITVIKLFIEMPRFPTRKTASLSLLKGYVACASYPVIPGAQYTEGTSDLSVHGPLWNKEDTVIERDSCRSLSWFWACIQLPRLHETTLRSQVGSWAAGSCRGRWRLIRYW